MAASGWVCSRVTLWIDSFVEQLIKALTRNGTSKIGLWGILQCSHDDCVCVCVRVCVCVCVSNGVTQETVRVVHQIKVHICVLWEAMYYMFTSGGQCTTCSHQVANVLLMYSLSRAIVG